MESTGESKLVRTTEGSINSKSINKSKTKSIMISNSRQKISKLNVSLNLTKSKDSRGKGKPLKFDTVMDHKFEEGAVSTLFDKRQEFKIYDNDIDVTPKTLEPLPEFNQPIYSRPDTKSKNMFFSTALLNSQIKIENTGLYPSQQFSFSTTKKLKTEFFENESSLLDFFRPDSADIKYDKNDSTESIEIEESLDYIEPNFDFPNEMTIVLQETPVFYLIDLPSKTAEKNTRDGQLVEEDNMIYDYLTIGKGRNRKTVSAETQTIMRLLKTRKTNTTQNKTQNHRTHATTWDIRDTYEAFATNQPSLKQKHKTLTHEGQLIKLLKNPRFQLCLIIMGRVLANNIYNREQKIFRGLIAQDPFRADISFDYKLKLLWTFRTEKTQGHPVSSMHWNPANGDILAVGYGKFYYHDDKRGVVYVWNIKNPKHPEREKYYNSPVTAVQFCAFEPNQLAVALYDSTVYIVDISTKRMEVLYTSHPGWSPGHEPVWQLRWGNEVDFNRHNEFLMCSTNAGIIYRLNYETVNQSSYGETHELNAVQMMKIIPAESKIKGNVTLKTAIANEIPASQNSSAQVFTVHLDDTNIYSIGTDTGIIHRCSTHLLDSHLEMFQAHDGPVTACEFSPFCSQIFLTSGVDWNIHIWLQGTTEPLVTLKKSMEGIEKATWHPKNATILAHIAGTEIYMWDIQQRTYKPVSTHTSPTNSRNTLVQFTKCGRNMNVSDIDGNVHIYSLEDMPFSPFYPRQVLNQTIRKNLNTRSDLLQKFNVMNKKC